jgi:DNA repair exonuclease SbcCD ATPase subunit
LPELATMEITETSDQSFERQHEQIEEKHRNEILNLLKSFEFEKKDMEARFREELEQKENGEEKYKESVDMENEKIDEHHFNPTSTNDLKSLSELETENRKLAEELNKSKDQILQMKNQIKDFTQKIEDIEKVLEDSDFPSDKKDILSQILQGTCNVALKPAIMFDMIIA